MSPLPHEPQPFDEILERFIDGTLAGDELASFERRLENEPELRAQLELQSRIDESLRRMCSIEPIPMPIITPADLVQPLDEDGLAEPNNPSPAPIPFPRSAMQDAGDQHQTRQPAPWRRWGILAAAAALLLTFAGLYRGYWDARVPDFRLMEPVAMYDRLVRTGWVPAVVCRTEPEFAALVKEKLGTALVATATPGIEVLGWGYQDDYDGSPISPGTMMLLTRVEGVDVLVLMDKTSRDRRLKPPTGSSLKIFRREIGPLVTYEVTPLDQPKVLPTLRQPE